MRKLSVILGITFLVISLIYFDIIPTGGLFGLDPKGAETPGELMNRYKKYHNNGDVENMMQLYYTENTTPMFVDGKKKQLEKLFSRKVISIELKSLDARAIEFFNKVHEANGSKMQHNLPVTGQIDAYLESKNTTRVAGGIYGMKDSLYYFVLMDFVK